MTLKQTRLVITDVAKQTRFYESVSQSKAEIVGNDYVQFQSKACEGLAIIEQALTQAYGEGVAEAGANRSVILDFEVDDVDAEYERLQASVSDWVMAPRRLAGHRLRSSDRRSPAVYRHVFLNTFKKE
jgi:hypothetical protein